MPVMTGADVYGNQAQQFVGVRSQTTAVEASGSIGNIEGSSPNTNASFSWVAFICLLILIRVIEEFAPTSN